MLKFYYNSTIMGDPSLLKEIRSLDQVYTPNVGSRLNRTVIHKDKRLYLELNIDINLCEIVIPQSFDLDSLKADFINEILNFLLASLRAFPVDTVNEMGFKLIFYAPNDSQASTDQWWSTTRLVNYSWMKTATNCNRTFLGKNEFKTPHSRFTLKFLFNQDRELIREPAVNTNAFACGNNVGTNFVGTFDTTFGGGTNNQFGGVNNQNTFGSVNTGGTNPQFGTTNNQSTFGGTNNQSTFGGTNNQNTFGGTNNQNTFGGTNNQNTFGGTNNQNTFGTTNNQSTFGTTNNQSTFGGTNNQSTFGGTNNPQNNQSTFGGTNNPQNNQNTFGGTNNPQNNQNIFGGTNSQFPSWGVGSNTQTGTGSAFSGFNTGQMTIGDWGAKW